MEQGTATKYDGGYSRHLKLKAARMAAWESAYKAQEKKIREDRQWINRFKSKNPAGAKSREKAVERLISSPDYVARPPRAGKPFKFAFPAAPRCGDEIVSLTDVAHGYNDRPLFSNVDLTIARGDKIAFLGPNGAGKSTLMRIALGMEDPAHGGAVSRGSANVVANYFEQNQADALDLDKVFGMMWRIRISSLNN